MRVRWWIVGAVVVMAGSVLVVRHLLQEKKFLHFTDEGSGEKFEELSAEYPESEFEELDFLI